MLTKLRHFFVPSRQRLWIIVQLALVAALHVVLTIDLNPPVRGGLVTGILVTFQPTTVVFVLWTLLLAISQHVAEAAWGDGGRALRRGAPLRWLPTDSLLLTLVADCLVQRVVSTPQGAVIWILYAVGIVELLRIWQPSGRIVAFDGGATFVFLDGGSERIVAKLPASGSAATLDPYAQLVESSTSGARAVIVLDSRPLMDNWRASSLPRILQVTASPTSRRYIEAAAAIRSENEVPLRLLLELRRAWALVVVAAVACLDGGAALRLGRFIPFVLGLYLLGTLATVAWSRLVFGRVTEQCSNRGEVVMLDGLRGPALARWLLWLLGMCAAAGLVASYAPLSASFEIVDRLMAKLDRDLVLMYALFAILVLGRLRASLEDCVRRYFSAIAYARIEEGEVVLMRPFALDVHRAAVADVETSPSDESTKTLSVGGRTLSGRVLGDNKAWRTWVEALRRAQSGGYR